MDRILKFILENCSYLYKKFNFKFKNSEVSDSFDGDAYLILESDKLKLRFISDRSQLFLEFSDISDASEWFSIEVVRNFITGEHTYYSILNSDNAEFLEKNLERISDSFSNININQTKKTLHALEKKRSKDIFHSS